MRSMWVRPPPPALLSTGYSVLRRPDGVADASDPPKVWALVRIQVGILTVLGVWRRHATLRRSEARFDSWRGHSRTRSAELGTRNQSTSTFRVPHSAFV